MYRYTVPIDGQAHNVGMSGEPVAVAVAPDGTHVEFWAESNDLIPVRTRVFRAFGTGRELPFTARHVGTCPRTPDGYVWHLYEVAR